MRRPRRQFGQNNSTFDAEMGISLDSRPPCGLRRLGLTCLYTRLTPSTTTLFSLGSTRNTLWARPFSASSPAITSTRSSLRTCIIHNPPCIYLVYLSGGLYFPLKILTPPRPPS